MAIEKEKFFEIIKNVSESKDLNENNLLERIKNELLKKDERKYSTYNDLRIDKIFSVLVDSNKIVNYTLLHLAVECENAKVVECLLKNRIKVDEPICELDGAKSKLTALHIAASHGCQEIIRLLLDANANPLLENSEGLTPRGMVCNVPNKDAIIKMLEEGEIRYATNQSEARATRRQTYRSSNTLLQPNNKASEDCKNNEQTSLNSITNANKVDDTLEREQALKEREAKAQQLKEAEQRFAANRKRVKQEYLHDQHPEQYTPHNGEQASLNLTTDESSSNDSGICVPTEEAHEELVKYLKEHKENVNKQDGDGRTLLHFAVAENDEELVKLLIAHGANINAQDRAEHTPLYYAVANDNKKLAKFLINHGADRSLIKDEDLIDRLNSMSSQLSEVASSRSKTNNVTEVQEKEKTRKPKVKLKRSCAQLEEEQKEHQSLKRKIHDLENENVALKNKLEKTKNQHSETNEVLLEKAQKDLVELKNCVAGHETRLKTFDKLYEENKSLKQKVQNLESENAKLKSELKEIKNQHSKYVAENETRQEALNKQNQEKSKLLEQEIKNLRSENAKLKSELEKNKDQYSRYLARHEARSEAFNKRDEENKLLKQEINNLKSENAKLNSELEKNKNQHSKYVAENENRQEAFNRLDEENKSLKQKIEDLESKNVTLNSELEKNKNQHSQTSEVSLKKVEKKPPLSKVAYVSLVATSIVGSIFSIVSGLSVLSMIATSVTSALVAGGITYMVSKPTTELKGVAIQGSVQHDVGKFNL